MSDRMSDNDQTLTVEALAARFDKFEAVYRNTEKYNWETAARFRSKDVKYLKMKIKKLKKKHMKLRRILKSSTAHDNKTKARVPRKANNPPVRNYQRS